MKTQLDEKQELINRLEVLSASDVRALKVFVAGMDTGKSLQPPAKAAKENRCDRVSKNALSSMKLEYP